MNILFASGHNHLHDATEIINHLKSMGNIVDGVSVDINNMVEFLETETGDSYDLLVSYYYPYILSKKTIESFKYGAINCHASFLPFNRGVHTNVWPIIDCTPAGVSIHHMVAGLDKGNVLWKKEIDVSDYDTGETLYEKLRNEMMGLFFKHWEYIESHIEEYGQLPKGEVQDNELATYHKVSDLAEIRDLSNYFTMSEMTTIREFIDITRACTFSGYNGAYITNDDGERVYYNLTPHKEI